MSVVEHIMLGCPIKKEYVYHEVVYESVCGFQKCSRILPVVEGVIIIRGRDVVGRSIKKTKIETYEMICYTQLFIFKTV